MKNSFIQYFDEYDYISSKMRVCYELYSLDILEINRWFCGMEKIPEAEEKITLSLTEIYSGIE